MQTTERKPLLVRCPLDLDAPIDDGIAHERATLNGSGFDFHVTSSVRIRDSVSLRASSLCHTLGTSLVVLVVVCVFGVALVIIIVYVGLWHRRRAGQQPHARLTLCVIRNVVVCDDNVSIVAPPRGRLFFLEARIVIHLAFGVLPYFCGGGHGCFTSLFVGGFVLR